jgi:hypothetical protein
MQKHMTSMRWKQLYGLGCIAFSTIVMTGCQVDVGGQTLPSPYYLYDDIQYFPSGPEFKLSQEAAAMKAYEAEAEFGGP